jgi:PIN domain nuclease of toxin-antitoxin system
VKLLLDTHVLIWIVEEPKRVPLSVAMLVKAATSSVFVSAASAWEIAIKAKRGKLKFDSTFLDDFEARLMALAIEPLQITVAHAVAGGRIEGASTDPFDRLIAAQAITEGLTVATLDPAIAALGAKVVW